MAKHWDSFLSYCRGECVEVSDQIDHNETLRLHQKTKNSNTCGFPMLQSITASPSPYSLYEREFEIHIVLVHYTKGMILWRLAPHTRSMHTRCSLPPLAAYTCCSLPPLAAYTCCSLPLFASTGCIYTLLFASLHLHWLHIHAALHLSSPPLAAYTCCSSPLFTSTGCIYTLLFASLRLHWLHIHAALHSTRASGTSL